MIECLACDKLERALKEEISV